ncbi:BRCA1-associated protein [Trichonephila clavipes]|nr:BRCA1-associated protein [Trichonephila clavipes]
MTGHIYRDVIREQHVRLFRGTMGAEFMFMDDNARPHRANIVDEYLQSIATAGSDVVQSGRPIFDDFFQLLWPYIGNNTANVVFQMVKRLCLIRIDQ